LLTQSNRGHQPCTGATLKLPDNEQIGGFSCTRLLYG
jgi:hypothetical protein